MNGNHFGWNTRQSEWLSEEINDGLQFAADVAAGKQVTNGYDWNRYKPATLARFKECADGLARAAAMFKRVDSLLAGDDGEDSFHTRWEAEVPKDPPRELLDEIVSKLHIPEDPSGHVREVIEMIYDFQKNQ